MSNTRHAQPGSPFNQEKFSSSLEFERGLNAVLVARHCELVEDPKTRELIWFLQLLSHQPGGLKQTALELVTNFPSRVATRSMLEFGTQPGRIYSAAQVRQIRKEMDCFHLDTFQNSMFPLKGDLELRRQQIDEIDDFDYRIIQSNALEGVKDEFPDSYPVEAFLKVCRDAAGALDLLLMEICLNPEAEYSLQHLWYFPDLIETLHEYQAQWIGQKRSCHVVTELGRQLSDTLESSLQAGCMSMVSGQARTGKTFAAKAWCELHPGLARYVQVPASNDDIGFFRAIAEALGLSSSLSLKGVQMRERIEKVLQSSQLMLVMDEAHYLWPQNNRREALPNRINWLMTALVNYGVPVALITTPQFQRDQQTVEKKTGWNSAQFIGRVGLYRQLPESLSVEDLEAVARSFLPEGEAKTIRALADYARVSAKYVAGIESTVRFARIIAGREKRQIVSAADIRSAIKDNVIPSDQALTAALAAPAKAGRGRAIAAPPRPTGAAVATPARNAAAPGADHTDEPNNLTGDRIISLNNARQDLDPA